MNVIENLAKKYKMEKTDIEWLEMIAQEYLNPVETISDINIYLNPYAYEFFESELVSGLNSYNAWKHRYKTEIKEVETIIAKIKKYLEKRDSEIWEYTYKNYELPCVKDALKKGE